MKKWFTVVLASLGLTLFGIAMSETHAWAGDFRNCTVSDVQFTRIGSASYFVFRAVCVGDSGTGVGTLFFYAPPDTESNRLVSNIVTSAVLSNRKVNVNYPSTSTSTASSACTSSFTSNLYSGTWRGSIQACMMDTVSLRQP